MAASQTIWTALVRKMAGSSAVRFTGCSMRRAFGAISSIAYAHRRDWPRSASRRPRVPRPPAAPLSIESPTHSRSLRGYVARGGVCGPGLEASTLVTATAFFIPTPLIMAALVLDALAGDPRWLPHPVVLIGHAITWGEQRLHGEDSRSNFNNGLVLVVCVIALATGATWVVITLCGVFSAWIAAPAAPF